MSIQITIGLGDDNVSADALDMHMTALGFARRGERFSKHYGLPERDPAAPVEVPTSVDTTEPAKPTRSRKKADETKPAISANPEDRRPPEDDAETQAQDAADEQAEVEADRASETPLTVDDVRAALGLYVNKHGMPATQQDGVKIFEAVLGKPPQGEAAWKLTLLADMPQEKLWAVIDAFTKAAASDKRYGA